MGCQSLTPIDCATAMVMLMHNAEKKSDVVTFPNVEEMPKYKFKKGMSYSDVKKLFVRVCLRYFLTL